LTRDRLIESFVMRKRIFHANCPCDDAATRAAESGQGGLSTTAVTVNGCQSRNFARMLHFHLANCASRRCARLTAANSDRAERLNPNIWFSSRDSYQRRGHLTVSKVGSYRLIMPRSTVHEPVPSLRWRGGEVKNNFDHPTVLHFARNVTF